MPELLRGTSERRQMEHYSLNTFCAILLLFHNLSLLGKWREKALDSFVLIIFL